MCVYVCCVHVNIVPALRSFFYFVATFRRIEERSLNMPVVTKSDINILTISYVCIAFAHLVHLGHVLKFMTRIWTSTGNGCSNKRIIAITQLIRSVRTNSCMIFLFNLTATLLALSSAYIFFWWPSHVQKCWLYCSIVINP